MSIFQCIFELYFEAQAGVEPANNGFADRCVNHFTTGPIVLLFFLSAC
jgi:hypothetical protein